MRSAGILFLLASACWSQRVVILTSTASLPTWTVPSNWNNAANTIECIGGGGSGRNTNLDGGGNNCIGCVEHILPLIPPPPLQHPPRRHHVLNGAAHPARLVRLPVCVRDVVRRQHRQAALALGQFRAGEWAVEFRRIRVAAPAAPSAVPNR